MTLKSTIFLASNLQYWTRLCTWYLLLQLQLVSWHFPQDKQGPQRKNLIGCWGFDGWETRSSQIGKQASNTSLSFRSAPFFLTSTLYPPPFITLSALGTQIVEEMYMLSTEFGLSSFLCHVALILEVMFFPCKTPWAWDWSWRYHTPCVGSHYSNSHLSGMFGPLQQRTSWSWGVWCVLTNSYPYRAVIRTTNGQYVSNCPFNPLSENHI